MRQSFEVIRAEPMTYTRTDVESGTQTQHPGMYLTIQNKPPAVPEMILLGGRTVRLQGPHAVMQHEVVVYRECAWKPGDRLTMELNLTVPTMGRALAAVMSNWEECKPPECNDRRPK